MGTILYLGYALFRKEGLHVLGRRFLYIAVVTHLVSLVLRTLTARQLPGHGWYVPWSNWFESFSFFTLVITVEYLILKKHRRVPILGAFIMPMAITSLLVAVHSPAGREIPLLPSALQSPWMAFHVSVMFISYAGFALAFGVGLAYLLQEWQIKSKRPGRVMYQLPSLEELDQLIYRIILIAFPTLTIGLGLGMAWAHEAWGRLWGWDAKETWAFISWLVYLLFLLMRYRAGWRGRKAAYLVVLGFILILITYAGINHFSSHHVFLLSGGR